MNQSNSDIESINTTLRIVCSLVELKGGGITDVSNHLDIPKSTVHNHISTLHRNEYIVKEGNLYHLSSRFFELGNQRRNELKLFNIAKSRVQDLAEKTGEIAALTIEEHGHGVLLHVEKGENSTQYEMYSGMRTPLHTTSTGKVILAQYEEEQLNEIIEQKGLEQVTPNTITSEEELKEELAIIREEGFAIHRGERMEGVLGAAVPILDKNQEVCGALGVSGPMSRLGNYDFKEELVSDLHNEANIIEVDLNYS